MNRVADLSSVFLKQISRAHSDHRTERRCRCAAKADQGSIAAITAGSSVVLRGAKARCQVLNGGHHGRASSGGSSHAVGLDATADPWLWRGQFVQRGARMFAG